MIFIDDLSYACSFQKSNVIEMMSFSRSTLFIIDVFVMHRIIHFSIFHHHHFVEIKLFQNYIVIKRNHVENKLFQKHKLFQKYNAITRIRKCKMNSNIFESKSKIWNDRFNFRKFFLKMNVWTKYLVNIKKWKFCFNRFINIRLLKNFNDSINFNDFQTIDINFQKNIVQFIIIEKIDFTQLTSIKNVDRNVDRLIVIQKINLMLILLEFRNQKFCDFKTLWCTIRQNKQ